MRPVAETGFEIPGVTLEPGRPAPGRRVHVHARGRFAEDFEHRRIVLCRLDSAFPLEQHDVTGSLQRAMGDDLDEFPVECP